MIELENTILFSFFLLLKLLLLDGDIVNDSNDSDTTIFIS